MEGKERLSFGCTVKNFERRNELALPSKWWDQSQAFYSKWFFQVYANKSPLRMIMYLYVR
jgi:hypothetical protein